MTTETHRNHEADCLMCAVRALTEGDPKIWVPEAEGDNASGVVLKMGEVSTDFGRVPFVDLWLGGNGRVRIMAYGVGLRHAIESVAPQIGDTMFVWFDGSKVMEHGRFKGRVYKAFSANVQRGHSS